jgi:hypothetical protein
LTTGQSPYSDETAKVIQNFAYGRPAEPGEHELRVAYPLYSIILFSPFGLVSDYDLSRALWMTLLEFSLIITAFLSLRLVNFRPPLILLGFYMLFTVLWYHSLRTLINGNAVILIGLLFVGAFIAVRSGSDEVAGVLLGIATIKPQVVLLPIIFVIVFSLSNRRWRLIAWLVGTITILSAIMAFFLPDWIQQNFREVVRYPGYNPPGTPGSALDEILPGLGKPLGNILSAGVGILLLKEWFAARKAGFEIFLWTACLTIVLSPWIGIQTDPGNFVVMLPALTMCLWLLSERWPRRGWLASSGILLILLIGLWWLFLSTLETVNGQPQQSAVMFFPLPALLGGLLLWLRSGMILPSDAADTLQEQLFTKNIEQA